jgi:hypothetical protein
MIQTRSQLLEAAKAPPPAELLWRGETPDWLVAAHDAEGLIPAVDLVTLAETEGGEPLSYGGRGFFRLGETILPDLPTGPRYLKILLRNRGPDRSPVRDWIDGLSRPDLKFKRSDRPVLVCVHPNWNYGHFLIEILPRLVLLDEAAEPGLPILLAGRAPEWLVACIGLVAPGRALLRFNPSRAAVTAPCFIGLSDVFTDAGLSPGFLPKLAPLADRLSRLGQGEPTPAKLFLSRGGLGKSRHVIENIEEIEAVAVALGYRPARRADLGPVVAIDCETMGLNPHRDRLCVSRCRAATATRIWCRSPRARQRGAQPCRDAGKPGRC